MAPLGLFLGSSSLLFGSFWPRLGLLLAPLGFPWDALGLVFFECFRGSRPGTGLVGLGAPRHVFVGSSWPPLGSFWAPLGLVLASFWLPLGSPQTLRDLFFTNVFVGLALGPVLSASALKNPFLWLFLVPLGLLLAPLGLLLACSWHLLGSSWAPLGLLFAPLGLP